MWAQTPISCWPVLWASAWLCGWHTTWAWKLSGAALQYGSRRPSGTLLKLHVSTLRLNPSAGRRPRYEMRGEHLRLVKRS